MTYLRPIFLGKATRHSHRKPNAVFRPQDTKGTASYYECATTMKQPSPDFHTLMSSKGLQEQSTLQPFRGSDSAQFRMEGVL